ncbi:hypothetical protein FOZ62_027971, partial [Perkinsus olseni]
PVPTPKYSSSGDYFQVRRRLMVIRMASGDYSNIISRYEDFCDEFINLAEQLLDDDDLSEKAYRKEIVGYFLHGLDPAVTRRIERDYEPEELEDHPTYSCPLTVAPGLDSGERCDKCGLYHPTAEEKMRCKARDSSQLICVRCRKIGHLARACPANFADPLPKEERNKIYQNAKNGRNLYDAARATPDGKVAEKVAPAAGKSAGMAVVETKPIPQEGDTLDELDSLYRAVKLIKKVMLDCPKVEKVTFFTDSEITIHRLRAWSSGKYQRLGLGTFEKNRLQKINGFLTRRRFTVEHIIGRANPADAATRPGKETLTSKEIDYGLKKSKRIGNLRYDPQAYKSVVNAFSVATERTRDGEDYELVLPGDSQLRSKLVQSQLRDQWIQGMKIKIKEGATLKSPQTRGLQVDEGTGLLGKRTLSWNAADGKRTVDLGGLRYTIPDADTLLQDETIARLHIHGGVPMNIRRLCSEFYFKHMKAKCKKYVNNCDVCEKLRADRSCRKATGALPSWQVGWLPWECISLDYVGPLCPGAELPVQKDENPSGFRYYLSFVDVATKYMINVPVRDRSVSSLIATVKEVFLEREQVPKCLITDREQSFLSKAFQSFLLSLPFTIHHVTGAPYQGPHAGHYERLHADITKFLQGALVAAGEDTYCWHRHLQHATQLHNTLPYDECIDVSPAELFRGYVPRKAMDNATVSRAIRDVAEQLKETRDIKFREYRRLWELRRSDSFEKMAARPVEAEYVLGWSVEDHEATWEDKSYTIPGLDDDVDHWVECTRCGKWRLVTQEECERFKDEDDVTWYDDVEKTSTLVNESEALPVPIKQVKSSMNGFGSLVVFLLPGDDSTTTLTHSLGVIEE